MFHLQNQNSRIRKRCQPQIVDNKEVDVPIVQSLIHLMAHTFIVFKQWTFLRHPCFNTRTQLFQKWRFMKTLHAFGHLYGTFETLTTQQSTKRNAGMIQILKFNPRTSSRDRHACKRIGRIHNRSASAASQQK